jgi:hypothetical protein
MMNRQLFWGFALLAFAYACDRAAPPTPARSQPEAAAPAPSSSSSSSSSPSSPSTSSAPSTLDASITDTFEAVIGEWRAEDVDGTKGFAVDGTKWRDGTPSANLADQSKRLYGDRYAEFLDGVKAFAFFPLAISRTPPPQGENLRLSVRFYPKAGKIDQGAGIAFAIREDGSYWGVRANALEDNVLFFHVVKGKRTVLETIRNVPTPTRTWHTLALEIRGTKLDASLDGTKRLTRSLDALPKGRVGLWSKADSYVVFADFSATSL